MAAHDDILRSWRPHASVRWSDDDVVQRQEAIAEEIPIALAYNGISHAVMLATPADLEDFGIGFSLSEGIVDRYGEIRDVEIGTSCDGITVDVAIGNEAFARLKARRRNLTGRTGCGLCGTESLAQVMRPVARVASGLVVPTDALQRAAATLAERQPLHAVTGAVHAAAWAHADGTLDVACEDIGRHNALDKLIGALARRRADFGKGFVLLTSRASSEMVQKAATVGIPLLAAISAPTGLAIRIADDTNVTLVAWLRPGRLALFAHAERVRIACEAAP